MNKLNYCGMSTQSVINYLQSRDVNEPIEVTTWNGNVRTTTCGKELREMRCMLQEEHLM